MIGRGKAVEAEVTGGKHRRGSVVPIRPEVLGAIMNDRPAFDPSARSVVIYRRGETNWCPGCGRQHWLVGRVTAECAFCATALPLADNRR